MTATAPIALALSLFLCIWDSDTLDDELLGLPDAKDLVVTGRWVRHGRAYYEKRLKEIPARLEKQPDDLDAYDDLAVAQDRLGNYAAALAVMERKARTLESHPDTGHTYRLLANRGTFLSHAGRYDEAVADLEKAVAMNPDSHFGREKFQIALVRYLGAAKKDPAVWRAESFLSYARIIPDHRFHFFRSFQNVKGMYAELKPGDPNPFKSVTHDEAYAAVTGMLRFAGPESAELYRVLGDLLGSHGRGLGDMNLAWWAWHRALDLGHPARPEIDAGITRVEEHWEGAGLLSPPSEEDFRRMRENGDLWLANYQAAEAACVTRGEDPGEAAALKRSFGEADRMTPAVPSIGHLSWTTLFSNYKPLGFVLAVLLLISLLVLKYVLDQRKAVRAMTARRTA